MNAPANQRLSLKQYYASGRGLATAIAAVVTPFASKLFGPDSASLVFPPLGSIDGVSRIGFLLLCISVSVGVYFIVTSQAPKTPTVVIWIAIAVLFICLASYLALYQRFVIRIAVPSQGTSVHISIGYHRTQFADQTFGSASDSEMLRSRGADEEEIERLWTMKSLIVARLGLFLSCTLTTMSFLFLVSFALAHDISSQVPTKTKSL